MIKVLNSEEFKTQITNQQVQLFDVRTWMEHKLGTIKGAKLLDVSSSDFIEKAKKEINFSQPIYVFCRSGARSQQASMMLEKLGAKQVYDLAGGYMSYKK